MQVEQATQSSPPVWEFEDSGRRFWSCAWWAEQESRRPAARGGGRLPRDPGLRGGRQRRGLDALRHHRVAAHEDGAPRELRAERAAARGGQFRLDGERPRAQRGRVRLRERGRGPRERGEVRRVEPQRPLDGHLLARQVVLGLGVQRGLRVLLRGRGQRALRRRQERPVAPPRRPRRRRPLRRVLRRQLQLRQHPQTLAPRNRGRRHRVLRAPEAHRGLTSSTTAPSGPASSPPTAPASFPPTTTASCSPSNSSTTSSVPPPASSSSPPPSSRSPCTPTASASPASPH